MGDEIVFKYVGAVDDPATTGTVERFKTIDLRATNFRDERLWQVTTEPVGYIDVKYNRITRFDVGNEANNFVAISGDEVTYERRGGNNIGGLMPRTYWVIACDDDPYTAVDESHYFKLAISDQKARDSEQGVDLKASSLLGTNVELNRRSFNTSDVRLRTAARGFGTRFSLFCPHCNR